MNKPLMRQLFVTSSAQLVALSTGGIIGYTTILLQQFKEDDSNIKVDSDTATWIASVHGLAGVPSIIMPTIMQQKGRKFAFIASCLLIITGWTIACLSRTVHFVIFAECIHGLGLKSALVVSLLTMNEMVAPNFRNICFMFYGVNQIIGITSTHTMGRYLHLKTVGMVMCVPAIFALIFSCFWPESPVWLAYRLKFEECKKSFFWLRGDGEESRKELSELISNQKVNIIKNKSDKIKVQVSKKLWFQVTSKDFYLPSLHTLVLLSAFYWSGGIALLIYSMEMIEQSTRSENAAFVGILSFDVVTIVGSLTSWIFFKYFQNKSVFMCSGLGASLFLLFASTVSYLQTVEIISKDSLLGLYSILGYMISISLGIYTLSFSVSAELMPVKHKGLGGAMYVIFVCVLHTSSIKTITYLFVNIGLHGTFALYAIILLSSLMYVWRFIPETKNRTLQEIENYYLKGKFITTKNKELLVAAPIVEPEAFDEY